FKTENRAGLWFSTLSSVFFVSFVPLWLTLLLALLARLLRRRPLLEDFRHRQGEPGEHVAAVEGAVGADRLLPPRVPLRVDVHLLAVRVHVPDQPHPGLRILRQLDLHLPPRVPRAE